MSYDPGSSNLNTELSTMTPSDPPKRKKTPFKFTFKHFVIFMVLFILMLAGITIVESVVQSQLQKQRAEAVCIAGFNGADAELDYCIKFYLVLSEVIQSQGGGAEEVKKLMDIWIAGQLKE